MSGPGRTTVRDADGKPLLSYAEGRRGGLPWADLLVVADGVTAGAAVAWLLAERPGWAVSAEPVLGAMLLACGARALRHAHTMERDLLADPPPPGWKDAALPGGVRTEAIGARPAEDLFAAHAAAFGPDHLDRRHSARTAEEQEKSLRGLLAGEALGPLLPGSALAVAGDVVVGAITVNDRGGLPWIGTVFRDPDPAWAGLGAALVRRAVAAVAASGRPRTGLAVTDGNPARALYARLGFAVTDTSLTVVLPSRSGPVGPRGYRPEDRDRPG